MQKMTVAVIGLNINPKENVTHAMLNLPENTEILSVHALSNHHTIWVDFMAPTESFEIDISQKFHFLVCKCNYTQFEMNGHKYLGNVNIQNTSYAVFYN